MVSDWDNEKRLVLLSGSVSAPTTEKSLTWVTQLPACIRKEFNNDLKEYLPENVKLRIAYQKPQSLKTLLFNPKSLEAEEGGCARCGSCKLCGKHGSGNNMVKVCTSFKTKVKHKFKTFKLKSNLNCKSSGIYVALCSQENCHESYVGQTTTEFRTRISQHRNKWVKGGIASLLNRDDTALLDHYREFHPEIYKKWVTEKVPMVGFDQAFEIVFADKVGHNLLEQEDSWQKRLQSSINRCRIILPEIID